MTATAAQVAQIRRWVNEPTTDTYSDTAIEDLIESFPVADVDGYDPDETAWTATYDLNAAAAEIWLEKASAVAADYSFSADGASLQRAQVYENYMKLHRRHNARRYPASHGVYSVASGRDTAGWRGNLPENP